jgi:hypothetical protein
MALRKKKKQEESAAAPAPAAQSAPVSSGGYVRSHLTTFDGKGNPTVIEYSTDSVGRTVKRRMGRGRSH